MARTEVNIEILQNPENNHGFKYIIKDNGTAIPYINSDNVTYRVMEKRFIKKESRTMGHFSSSDKQYIIDILNENAGFNGDITDLVYIPKDSGEQVYIFTADNGYITADTTEYTADENIITNPNGQFPSHDTGHPYLIGVIGNFTQYTYADNTTVDVNKFCLINFDKLFLNDELEFYYTQDNMFESNAIVNSIAYNSIRGEIAIGGDFDVVYTTDVNENITASNVLYFSPKLKEIVIEKTKNVYNNGGFNDEVLCVQYGRGNELIVSGKFTEYLGTTRGYLATINTTGGLDVGFSNNADINGIVKRHHVTPNGVVYIVGEFTMVNGTNKKHLAQLDIFGNSNNNFNLNTNGFDVAPNDVTTYKYSIGNSTNIYIFVGGDFTQYNGVDVGNIIKFNTSGNRLTTFNTSGVNIKVNRLTIMDIGAPINQSFQQYNMAKPPSFQQAKEIQEKSPDNLYVSGGYSDDNEVGALVINHLSGKVEQELYYNDEVNAIVIPEGYTFITEVAKKNYGKIIYGGKFTNYDNTNQVLEDNDVEVGLTMADTTINLFNELMLNNNNNNSTYQDVTDSSNDFHDILHTYLYFDGNIISVDDIVDQPGYIKIRVTEYDNSGNIISPSLNIRLMEPILLRSDYIIQGEGGQFDSTIFDLMTYKGSYNNVGNPIQEISVSKNKLTQTQYNTWINIPPIVDIRGLETFRAVDEYIAIDDVIYPSKQGMYGLVTRRNIQNGQEIHKTARVYFLLDGFRDRDGYYDEVPQLLINGNYREVVRGGRLLIPYNSAFTSAVIIRNGKGVVLDIIDFDEQDEYNEKIWTLDGYIMYYYFNPNDYSGDRFTLDFRGIKESAVHVRKRDRSCVADVTTVIFVNRWGILEETQMIGIEDKSLKIESTDYTRSIRDINGNLFRDLHSNTTLRKNGIETYKHSTGAVREGMNDVYEDLVLSKNIWMFRDGKLMPVVLKDTNFGYKNVFVDNIIEYQFEFEEANNKIKNNI